MSAMAADVEWLISRDRTTVRMQLPPLPMEGMPEPLRVHLDFDTATLDEMLRRLTELRARMLPAPTRN